MIQAHYRNSCNVGKRRSRNLVGEVYGPYRVSSYVGADPRNSECVRYECKRGCGYQHYTEVAHLNNLKRIKKCAGCLVMTEELEAAG
jgi:hypothetical protein